MIIEQLEFSRCVRATLNYVEEHFDRLNGLMPHGKGFPLMWHHEEPYDFMAEVFVRVKLDFLFKEIGAVFPDGSSWPRPMEGVADFFAAIDELNQECGENDSIEIGILSSGHDQFVQQCFRLWKCPMPSVILTDDTIRRMTHVRIAHRSKPSSFLLWTLLKMWNQEASRGNGFSRHTFESMKRELVYFGDDDMRDGNLARNNGVPFGLYDPTGKKDSISSGTIIRSWKTLADELRTQGPSLLAKL